MSFVYHVGIDTGGTYTDGVLLDVVNRKILKTAKTPTTHHDLFFCIRNILDLILPDDPQSVQLISISTTLVTNAIAENKLRTSGLFLIGYDMEVIKKFGFTSQFSSSIYSVIHGGHTLTGEEQCPLDECSLLEVARTIDHKVAAYAISGYFSPLNNVHEERAAAILVANFDKPVILGSQLSAKFDSIRRATTAGINASLLPVAAEFINAVRQVLTSKKIFAPLMIVRGDGGLMSSTYSRMRPVETIHSGPAASAIGAKFLAGIDDALVIDVGGTTTDLALLNKGRVRIVEEGTSVEKFSTLIRSANVRSFGLGGDSWIRVNEDKKIAIGPQRVFPLGYLQKIYPNHLEDVLNRSSAKLNDRMLEFWLLLRSPDLPFSDERVEKVISLLEKGPLSTHDLLKSTGLKNIRQIDLDDYVNRNIIGKAGLTPTDFFHYSKEFSIWDSTVVDSILIKYANSLGKSIEDLYWEIRRIITEKLIREIIAYLSQKSEVVTNSDQSYSSNGFGEWILKESIHPSQSILNFNISLSIPIVGVGAPASVFLPPVAEFFKTSLVLPTYYEVANAVGAATADVFIYREGEALVKVNNQQVEGFIARTGTEQKLFKTMEEAISYLEADLENRVRREAQSAGSASVIVYRDILERSEQMTRVRVTAMGRPDSA